MYKNQNYFYISFRNNLKKYFQKRKDKLVHIIIYEMTRVFIILNRYPALRVRH